MSYREIAKADCTFWNGFRPCDKQRLQSLPNCAGCTQHQRGEEILNLSNRPYSPEMLRCASKVGIVEMRGLGDILRTTAVSKRIREINPEAEIYWFTHTRAADLLQYAPGVKAVDFEKREHKHINPRMDVLINFDVSESAKEIVMKNDCIAGFALNNQSNFIGVSPHAEYLQRFQIDDDFRSSNTQLMQRIFLESIGLEFRGVSYDIKLRPENFTEAQEIIHRGLGKQDFKNLIGINLGSSQKGVLKRWPFRKHASLAVNLSNQYPDMGVLVLSGPEDSNAREDVIKEFSGRKVADNLSVLPNDLEIGNFMAIVDACSVLITSDTFAFHVAEVLKTPTIVLVGPMPAKELEAGFSSTIVGPKLECSPCFYKCTQPVASQCMIDITEEEVLDAVNTFFN